MEFVILEIFLYRNVMAILSGPGGPKSLQSHKIILGKFYAPRFLPQSTVWTGGWSPHNSDSVFPPFYWICIILALIELFKTVHFGDKNIGQCCNCFVEILPIWR